MDSTALALVALVALALSRSSSAAPRPPSSLPPLNAPAGGSAPTPTEVAGDGTEAPVDFWLDYGRKWDAASLEGRQGTWDEEERARASAYRLSRANLFLQQVWQPAQRVPVSSLTPEDYQLALRFLRNEVDRRNMPLTYGQAKRINDFNDTVEPILQVAHYLRIVANALTLGIWQGAERLGGAIAHAIDEGARPDGNIEAQIEEAKYAWAAVVAAVPGVVGEEGMNALSLVTQGPNGPTLGGPYSHRADDPLVDPGGYSFDFGFDPIEFDWGTIWPGVKLLQQDPEGAWRWGWICAETGYAGVTNDADYAAAGRLPSAERIAKVARLYRTLDVLRGAFRPTRHAHLGAKGIDYTVPAGLYAYRIGPMELWGCVLPPHPDDHAEDLANELGRDLAELTAGEVVMGKRAPAPTGTQLAARTAGQLVMGSAPPAPPASSNPLIQAVINRKRG